METHTKESPSTLTRRHTIATTTTNPTSLTIPNPQTYHTSSFPPPRSNGAVFPPPLLVLSPPSSSLAYTSLKDLLPSAAASSINSPTPSAAGGSAFEVPIRNRLVKQAACAYLQPMSTSPDSPPGFFLRLWLRLSSCLRFLSIRRIFRSSSL